MARLTSSASELSRLASFAACRQKLDSKPRPKALDILNSDPQAIWKVLNAYRMVGVFARFRPGEPITFSALEGVIQGISPGTLSTRLKELEAAGWVMRRIYNQYPPRMAYVLTPLGGDIRRELAEIFLGM